MKDTQVDYSSTAAKYYVKVDSTTESKAKHSPEKTIQSKHPTPK